MRLSPETILWAVLSIGITCELTAAARGSSRRPKCRKDEFECVNKQRCIHEFDVCDGKKDCPDGSDETASQCQEFGLSCGSQPFSFKCAYGACIDKSKECDNVEYDCADNSDEAQCHKSSDTPEVTSRCQSSEFTCQSGDCVDLNDVCDGISNCKDQSDETIKQCAQMTCQPFSFQCAYGACIDWVMRCDGKKDCADGSDEADELCNKPVDTPDVNKADELNSTTDTCPFPDHPNTIYEYVCQGDGCKSLSPGTPLKKLQAVRASCPPGYAFPNKFIKKNAMICLAPPKFHATITCEKMCPPLVSEFHELECIFNGKNVPCHSPMYPGTFARLECKEFYRPLSDVVVVTQTRCQDGGTWTYSLYKCIPDNANQEENNTASTPAAHIRTPQVVRLTGRTIICLALFESGLLPRVVLRPRTTPAPTRCSLLGDPCPNHIIISVHRIRVRRQAVASRYRRIIGQLNFYTRENHPLSSPIDDANEHMKSIRSLLIELQSLFPDEDVESQENDNYYETMAEIMERRRLQLGLAQCSLIDDYTLLAIIHMLERKFN